MNQVLVYSHPKNQKTFYVPIYIRLKVNRVSDINYVEGSATIETEIRFWAMIKEFPAAVR